jgi:hypothetical protein
LVHELYYAHSLLYCFRAGGTTISKISAGLYLSRLNLLVLPGLGRAVYLNWPGELSRACPSADMVGLQDVWRLALFMRWCQL